MTFPMTALSPSATKVIIDEEEAEDEATPLKSFKEIEEEKEAEKKREQRFVRTLPSMFSLFSQESVHFILLAMGADIYLEKLGEY